MTDRLTKHGHKFDMLNVMQGLARYTEVDEIMNRLAAYEDTGLTPAAIETITAEVARLKQTLADAKAFQQNWHEEYHGRGNAAEDKEDI